MENMTNIGSQEEIISSDQAEYQNNTEQQSTDTPQEQMPTSIKYFSASDTNSEGEMPDIETDQIRFVSSLSKDNNDHKNNAMNHDSAEGVTSDLSPLPLETTQTHQNPSRDQNKKSQPFCEKHGEEILCMFCVQCKVSVCRNCIVENHQKHDLDKIENRVNAHHFQTAMCLDKLVAQFRCCQKEIKTLEARKDIYCDEVTKLVKAFNENRDKLKSEIDHVTDDLIQHLHEREKIDLADLCQQKEYFESRLADIRECIINCEKQLINKNKVHVMTMAPELDNAPPYKEIYIPAFASKIPHNLYLQSHIGILSALPISTFHPQIHLNLVTTLNPNEALFACQGKPGIFRITRDGQIVKRIRTVSINSMFLMEDITVGDIAVTSQEIILISEFQGTHVWKGLSDLSKFKLVKNFQPFVTQGICTSVMCDLYVCLNLKNHHQVNRVSLNGEILQTISFAGSTLTQPMKIKVSKKGDIFILQKDHTQNAFDLVVMGANGHVSYIQKAIGRQKEEILCTYDLVIDKYGNILISNYDRSRIYLFAMEKKSLRYVRLKLGSDKMCRNTVTTGISLDEDGLLWTCNCYDVRDTLKTQVSIMKI